VIKSYIRSSGAGGQNINRRETCCQLTDKITGIQVKVMDKRTQFENEEIAWKRLEEKIKSIHQQKYDDKNYSDRFDQIGYGWEKHRRTYRIKEDMVIDHVTKKTASFKDFSRGKIELLS